MFDEAWEEFRAQMHNEMKNEEESMIKKWLNGIGYNHKEPIGYYMDRYNKIMTIYSTRPGQLIGKAGANVNFLKVMLTELCRGEWEVKFIEIRGGFVTL